MARIKAITKDGVLLEGIKYTCEGCFYQGRNDCTVSVRLSCRNHRGPASDAGGIFRPAGDAGGIFRPASEFPPERLAKFRLTGEDDG